MSMLKKLSLLAAAVLAVVAIGPVAAASAGTVTGQVQGSVLGIPLTPCEYQMTYTGGPPPTGVTMTAASFAGKPGSSNPCDPTTLTINNNISATFSGSGSNYTAVLSSISVTDATTGCTFTRSASTNATSTTGVNGPYSGSGSASGSGGFICLAGATLSLSAAF